MLHRRAVISGTCYSGIYVWAVATTHPEKGCLLCNAPCKRGRFATLRSIAAARLLKIAIRSRFENGGGCNTRLVTLGLAQDRVSANLNRRQTIAAPR